VGNKTKGQVGMIFPIYVPLTHDVQRTHSNSNNDDDYDDVFVLRPELNNQGPFTESARIQNKKKKFGET
jgi:hypothetical protein